MSVSSNTVRKTQTNRYLFSILRVVCLLMPQAIELVPYVYKRNNYWFVWYADFIDWFRCLCLSL